MKPSTVEVRGEGRLAKAVSRALTSSGMELVPRRGDRVVAFGPVAEAGAVVVDLEGRAGAPGQCVLHAQVALRGRYPAPWATLFERLLQGRPLRLGWCARVDVVTREDLEAAVVFAVQQGVVGDWRVPSAGSSTELAVGRALLVETGSSSVLGPAWRPRLGGVPVGDPLPGLRPAQTTEDAARAWIALYQKDRSDLARG